jgi:hypothetical protein
MRSAESEVRHKLVEANPPMKLMAKHFKTAIDSRSDEFVYTDAGLQIEWILKKT